MVNITILVPLFDIPEHIHHLIQISGPPFDRMNYLDYVKFWHEVKNHQLTDAVDMSIHLSSPDADTVDYEFFEPDSTLNDVESLFFSNSILY